MLLLSLAKNSGVCIIKISYDRLEKIMALSVIIYIIGELVKEFTIAGVIFIRVSLKAYFCRKDKQTASHINNLAFYF